MELNDAQVTLLAAKGFSRDQIAHLMSLEPSAAHIDTALSNLAVSYKNRDFIADEVCPVVSVNKRSNKIFEYPIATMQELAAEAKAGTRGRPGEVKYSLNSNTLSYSVTDYALMDFVSADEESNADAPIQPRAKATKIVTNHLNMLREQRVATLVFGSSNYGSNTQALAGANQWDQNTSDPVQALEDAIETCFVRPDTLVLGAQVYTKLRNHPKFLQYILSRAATAQGAVPLRINEQLIADAFGLRKCIVGRAKYNSANEGATVSSTYFWTKSAALLKVSDPSVEFDGSFATFRYGTMETSAIPDLLPGPRGGTYIKVAHSDADVKVAGGNSGYLFTTVVA